MKNSFIKNTLRLVIIIFLTAWVNRVTAQNRYSLKSGDFEIINVSIHQNSDANNPYLDIAVFFKQSRFTILAYPSICLVTNSKGDTMSTAHGNWFGHKGQDTLVYQVPLRNHQPSDFSTWNYYLSGFSAKSWGRDTCLLKFNGIRTARPTPVSINDRAITITHLEIYNPHSILPELTISVLANFPKDQMILLPKIKYIKSKGGKTLGVGWTDYFEFNSHNGQDTLGYRVFLQQHKIPNLKECKFYFCCIDPATNKEVCIPITFRGEAVVQNFDHPLSNQ